MEDIRFAAEDAIDEQPDEDDVEMDFGDATGSEGTSEEDGDDDDLENPSNESEEGWQDEDDEDEDNLVENEEENDDDAGEGHKHVPGAGDFCDGATCGGGFGFDITRQAARGCERAVNKRAVCGVAFGNEIGGGTAW